MLDIKKVEEGMENTRTTRRLLSEKKEERIMFSKKKLERYCTDSIMLDEIILVLLKDKG